MIVGLGFQARAGKDTVGSYLKNEYGFNHRAFAGPLKRAAAHIFKLDEDQLYGSKKEILDERWGQTPREILQKLGTEAIRNVFGVDTWVKSLQYSLSDEGDFVITDMRFPNEVEAVKAWGGFTVRIDRPTLPPISNRSHASETALDGYSDWDHVLTNDGDFLHLYRQVDEMLKKFRKVSTSS